jgi:hypothetical protein
VSLALRGNQLKTSDINKTHWPRKKFPKSAKKHGVYRVIWGHRKLIGTLHLDALVGAAIEMDSRRRWNAEFAQSAQINDAPSAAIADIAA